jgi:hypothetical protein
MVNPDDIKHGHWRLCFYAVCARERWKLRVERSARMLARAYTWNWLVRSSGLHPGNKQLQTHALILFHPLPERVPSER